MAAAGYSRQERPLSGDERPGMSLMERDYCKAEYMETSRKTERDKPFFRAVSGIR